MKPSDILNRAAEIMLERGHVKGTLEDLDGTVCLMGAINIALLGLANRPGWIWETGDTNNFLRTVIQAQSIAEWNDRPETTEAMALGALHDAALLAKEAGQ